MVHLIACHGLFQILAAALVATTLVVTAETVETDERTIETDETDERTIETDERVGTCTVKTIIDHEMIEMRV